MLQIIFGTIAIVIFGTIFLAFILAIIEMAWLVLEGSWKKLQGVWAWARKGEA